MKRKKNEIILLFRYDDYSSISSTALEKKLFESFDKVELSLTVGIIPAVTKGDFHDYSSDETLPFSEEKLDLIKHYIHKGTIDIALHGFNHINFGRGDTPSEFHGISYSLQCNKIKEGKRILEDYFNNKVQTFIPPWNTYDENTLKCLKENGIRCISANRYGTSLPDPYFIYLPITIEFDEIEGAIKTAEELNDDNQIITVLLHPYDFEESGDVRGKIKWDEFERKLSEIKQRSHIKVIDISQIVSEGINLNYKRFRANSPDFLENIFPPFIKTTYKEPIYKSCGAGKMVKTKKNLQILSLFTLALVLTVLFSNLLKNLFIDTNYLNTSFIVALKIILLSLAIYYVSRKKIYFRRFMLFLFIWSFLSGLIL